MILSQLVESEELQLLTPELLREMLLQLDEQIRFGETSGEKMLFAIEAQVIGVKGDQPAGAHHEVKLQGPGLSRLRGQSGKDSGRPGK